MDSLEDVTLSRGMFWKPVEPGVVTPADEFFSPGRFAALLAALVCVAYPDVITGQGAFFHRDFAIFGYPLAYHLRESFWHGEVPLWNPLNDCGLPFLAQWNTMTLYPPSLFYVLLPLSWSLGVFCLGHLFLGGMGMYFLAHRWTGNRFAAAVAGVAFSFSALMLHSLMWPNNIAALGWLPWVVLTAERAWREGGSRLVFAALTGAMQMLSGAPEVILLTWMLLAALWAGQMALNVKGRRQMCGRFVLVVLWVAGLAAAQLLPFLDLLAHSQRDKAFADSLWSMPVWGWANLVVPLFRSYPTSLGVYAQPEQYWIPSYYLGVGIIALAVLAVGQARNPRVALLGALTALCLLLALGKHGLIYSVLKHVLPGLGFMRYPIKFVLLPVVLVPLLAAFSLARCLAVPPTAWPGERRRIVALGLAFLGIISLLAWSAVQFPLRGTSSLVAVQSGLSRVVFLLLILGGIIALRRIDRPPLETLARIGLLLVLWLDAMTAGPRPNPSVQPWVYQPNLARKELHLEPPPTIGLSRTMLNAEAEGNLMVAPLTNAVDQVLYTRLAQYGNANLLDDFPKVVGMYSLFFRELGDVFGSLWISAEPPAGLADFLAVAYINEPGKVTHWNFRTNHMAWVSGGQKPLFASGPETTSALAKPEFDPRRSVFLPLEARSLVSVTNGAPAQNSVLRFSAHKVELEVQAGEPVLVVVAQSFYHNWRAYVGGKPTRLLRANHAFQAVEVPAGQHRVTLAYEDRLFYCGVVVSCISVAVLGVLWLRGRKRA